MATAVYNPRVKAKLFRGLGDPSRLAILEFLRDRPKNVSEIVAETGLSQPNTSLHLECLYCCGLVEREKQGRFVYYRIRSEATIALIEASERVLRANPGNKERRQAARC